MDVQWLSRLKVRIEDLMNKVNQLLNECKLSQSVSEEWKERFGEQIYEKYISIVTLEHLLRKDLETFFVSSSEWILRPILSSEDTLQALPDLLRTKPDQEYLKYLSENYSFYLQASKLVEKDSLALNLQLSSMQKTCKTLVTKVEEFLEQDNNNSIQPVGSQIEESVENSLCWMAYERGVGLI